MMDISQNIKKVLFVFLICFIGLISYLTYFEFNTAPGIVNNPLNKRLWAQRNAVLRGTIYDRDMQPLTKSERINELTQKRQYTAGALFSHVLGYVDAKYGITGLEKKYDSELMSDNEKFNIFGLMGTSDTKKEKVGNNLVTTVDSKLQKVASDALGSRKGAVVVLNPKTGEILSMVSKPSFDPNNLKDTWSSIVNNPDRPLLNRAVSGLYPPGSTFKTITAITALENMKDVKTRIFKDNGKLTFNDKEAITNFDGEVNGNLNIKDAFVYSSNVVFGTLGLELGNDKLKTTAEKFFFNKNTPADGIIIDNSRFPTYKQNEKGNIAQSAIGQSGVLATPVEMAMVASTIANGGIMMEPYLVGKVLDKDSKTVKNIEPKAIGQIISKDIADTLKDYMRAVVTSGTGTAADVKGMNVCGKTGTADHSDNGKVSDPHSWFIAFAPYENPTIAIAVIVEDGGQGGGAAAKIARAVLEAKQ